MIDLSHIPNEEMLQDRKDAIADIELCSRALLAGVTHCRNGMPVRERLNSNMRQIAVMEAELSRRGIEVGA